MRNMHTRTTDLELMDLGPDHYSRDEYKDCLDKLALIGKLFGANAATLAAFDQLTSVPKSILDVGCGSGAFALKLAQKYPNTFVLGTDLAPNAIEVANRTKQRFEKKHGIKLDNLTFELRSNPSLGEPRKSFDAVTATCLLHHLLGEEPSSFLLAASEIARQAIVINDLHRHPAAYAAFWCISPAFRNRLIRHDGLVSVRRAFTREDLERYVRAAGFGNGKWKVQWHWAFRWILTIDCT